MLSRTGLYLYIRALLGCCCCCCDGGNGDGDECGDITSADITAPSTSASTASSTQNASRAACRDAGERATADPGALLAADDVGCCCCSGSIAASLTRSCALAARGPFCLSIAVAPPAQLFVFEEDVARPAAVEVGVGPGGGSAAAAS